MGILALAVFVAVLMFWSLKLKRDLGEGSLVGFLAILPLGGTKMWDLFVQGIVFASTFSVLYAALAFTFMAYLMDKLGLVEKLLGIFNSVVGRLPGAPAYMDLLGSTALGTLSGGDSGNTAATGSVTGPWMLKNKWNKDIAASVMVGNGGLASVFPPTTSMFIVLGFAPVAAVIGVSEFYVALFAAAMYQFAHRALMIYYFVKKQGITAFSADEIDPLKVSLQKGWTSLLLYVGALLPLVLTIGPIAETLNAMPSFGEKAVKAINIVVWIPTLMIFIALLLGWKSLPKTGAERFELIRGCIPKFTTIGALIFFAVAASEVLTKLGLSANIAELMSAANTPPWLTLLIIGIGMTIIAGPLTTTGTLTAVGLVSYEILVASGFSPMISAIVIMIFASTSAQMPPASGSIYIAAGITGSKPESTFGMLIWYYAVPVVLIGWLIGMGIFPVYGA